MTFIHSPGVASLFISLAINGNAEINYARRRMIGYRSDPGAIPGSSTNVSPRLWTGFYIGIMKYMNMDYVRGVNIGGWLVLERWIVPSVFAGTSAQDEHGLVSQLGPESARQRLDRHRQTFITREDIQRIKHIGLNTIRLPVGYWLFEDVDGYIGGAYRVVDELFEWTAEIGIKVILCLHGASGSQNGWDHSGKAGSVGWPDHDGAYDKTLEILRRIARRYGQQPHLIGIEPLNEPHYSHDLSMLARFYKQAWHEIRQYLHGDVELIVSDAFRPDSMAGKLRSRFIWKRPVLDQHMYQLFTPEDRALDMSGHMAKTASWLSELKKRRQRIQIIIGEWSAAMDEQYHSELHQKEFHYTAGQYRKYAHEQQRVFENVGCGWLYWTAKTEDGGVWSLLDHPDFIKK